MKRDLGALDSQSFDVLVIGGGLVGASIARDAAHRGLSVALVERDDFACGASEGLPRLVVGGVGHHLPHGPGGLRRTLAEGALWSRIAPHRVAAQRCMVPIASRNPARTAAMRLAVDLYGRAGAGSLPVLERSAARLGAAEAVDLEPAIDQPALRGALVYFDWRIDEPERLVLALLKDAVAHGAVIANYAECDGLVYLNGKLSGARVYDRIGGVWLEAWSSVVVNATGAWCEATVARLLGDERGIRARLSREIRIVTQAIACEHALVFPEVGGGDMTIVPWRGMSIVGTATDAFDDDPANAIAEADDMTWLGGRVGDLAPAARDALAFPIDGFASVRARSRTPDGKAVHARLGHFVDHGSDGVAGFLSVGGGDWTTVRPIAERAVDRVVAILGSPARPCDTAHAVLAETADGEPDAFAAEWRRHYPYWPAGEIETWALAYGRALPEVLACAGPALRPGEQAREAARFAYAQDEEMAILPDDFARRLARWYEVSRPGVAVRAAEWLAGRSGASDPVPWETGR
ncbi:MAG: FAD-dependent oxidoreductase [Rhizobiaceae bacterium]|nr:MAG: FAD-dependent oxidoreductase [Rhizobiaceae bacterium]CAG1015284.1 glycerol-3-phosphate dehydrogenase [Rhizobiaceae bacterium]